MVKAYLKYIHKKSFSAVLTNSISSIKTVELYNKTYFIFSSNETIYFISVKTGDLDYQFSYQKPNTSVRVSHIQILENYILIGYSDGDIVIYDFKSKEQ